MTALNRGDVAAPSRAFSASAEDRFDGRQLESEQRSMRRRTRGPSLTGRRNRQEGAMAFGATAGSYPPESECSLRASRRAKTCG